MGVEKGCEFCSVIRNLILLKEDVVKGYYYPDTDEAPIAFNPENNTYHLWNDGGGDPCASGIMVEDILHCPKCGRLLHEKGER